MEKSGKWVVLKNRKKLGNPLVLEATRKISGKFLFFVSSVNGSFTHHFKNYDNLAQIQSNSLERMKLIAAPRTTGRYTPVPFGRNFPAFHH